MNINYNDWVRDNRRYLDASLKFMLSSMADPPTLSSARRTGTHTQMGQESMSASRS